MAGLFDFETCAYIRAATPEEQQASREAATRDGGRGVIDVDGRRCIVDVPLSDGPRSLTEASSALIQIWIPTTRQVWLDLQALADTGRFGRTAEEVAEVFIREGVRRAAVEGWIPMVGAPSRKRPFDRQDPKPSKPSSPTERRRRRSAE